VQSGLEVWGEKYANSKRPASNDDEGKELNRWIESTVRIWEKTSCNNEDPDCVDNEYKVIRADDGFQKREKGFIAPLSMDVQPIQFESTPSVLGVTTDINEGTVLQASEESESGSSESGLDDEFIELESESSSSDTTESTKIQLGDNAVKEVVVNTASLSLLGLTETEALGATLDLSFIIVGELLESSEQKVESIPAQYKIVGVIPDDRTPVMYVPFIDIKSLGVVNYSQAKILTNNQTQLPLIRTQVESLGFSTISVYDTVAQINNLFATARTVLFAIGMAALAVASLGMFNTLTVSLLERTREVGLMKAMGMRSAEVQDLFLTESMIMGLFGGFAGLFLGVGAGQLTSIVLSVIAIQSDVGYLNVSYTPPIFIIVILGLALTVGLITGLYPARHATKISALNALRYE
jgi:ABC-type lipoprotein release transport system permease subunit